jgi:hypothetical protein
MTRALNIITFVVVIVFFALVFFGVHGPMMMTDDKCYPIFLGCNVGFFGYDAFVHLASGVLDVVLVIWFFRKFPSINLFYDKFWKNFIIIVSLVTTIGFLWECVEFSHDEFRTEILHQDLVASKKLDQPSNDDTMGDIIFSILGAAITTLALKSFISKETA